QALEIAEQNLTITHKLLELAEVRRKAGAGTEVDVNLSLAPVLDAELAVKNARLEAGNARRALAKQLSLTDDADTFALNEPLPQPLAPLDAERLVTLAHEQRLDLQAAARAVDAAQARVQLAWRQVFPEIAIGVQTERFNERHQLPRRILADTARSSIAAGQLTAPPIQPRSERQRVRGIENNDIITGPSLSAQLPIFDQNQAQIAKAEFAYEQAAKGYQSLDISLT